MISSLPMTTQQRPSITFEAHRNPDQDGRRTHVPCGQGAILQVRSIAARTGLSQREIVTTILTKTDLATFVELWTGQRLESPTDIYRELGDGTIVKTATVDPDGPSPTPGWNRPTGPAAKVAPMRTDSVPGGALPRR